VGGFLIRPPAKLAVRFISRESFVFEITSPSMRCMRPRRRPFVRELNIERASFAGGRSRKSTTSTALLRRLGDGHAPHGSLGSIHENFTRSIRADQIGMRWDVNSPFPSLL